MRKNGCLFTPVPICIRVADTDPPNPYNFYGSGSVIHDEEEKFTRNSTGIIFLDLDSESCLKVNASRDHWNTHKIRS